MKTYKKLFNIKYNNKVFTIFVGEDGRKIFLELQDNNKYCYPTLEDFTYLTKIYNDKSLIDHAQKFSFDEKVRVGAATLALVSLINLTSCGKIKVEVENNEVIETVEPIMPQSENEERPEEQEENREEQAENNEYKVKTIYLKDVSELDDILEYKTISVEEVRNVIDKKDLPDKVREAAHLALNDMLKRVPDIDLRIFYENMKDLTYVEIPIEELQESEYIDAEFNCVERKITTHPNVSLKTLKHEMNHAFYSFYTTKGLTIYIRHSDREDLGTALIEAMTEKETTQNIIDGVYQNERYVLDVLLNLIDFTESDYQKLGVWPFIRLLQDKYPEIDVEHMIYELDCRKNSRLAKNQIEVLEPPISIMNDLFEMVKLKTMETPEDAYSLFAKFATAVINTCTEPDMLNYLDDYNRFLTTNSMKTIATNTFIKYQKILGSYNKILIIKGEKPILIEDYEYNRTEEEITIYYTTLDNTGNEITGNVIVKDDNDYEIKYVSYDNSWEYLLNHAQTLGTEEFLNTVIKENVSPHLYKKIPISMNKTKITTDYVSDLSVRIGITNTGEAGFMLYKDEILLYSTHPVFHEKTNIVPLKYYLPYNMKNLDSLDLQEYFNETYLKESEGEYSHWFTNLKLENGKYTMIPDYKIIITDLDGEEYPVDIRWCFLRRGNPFILNPDGAQIYESQLYYGVLPIKELKVDSTLFTDIDLQLEKILEETGILTPDKLEYKFTLEEYENLFLTYLYDRESNLVR